MTSSIDKMPSGIAGLDELTGGGLPAGRSTLVCGGPGCGKTLLAIGFLVHGALDRGEPGVLISFDQPIRDLAADSLSLGYDLAALQRQTLLATDYVHLERNELEKSGDFDLEGLFIRLDLAVRTVGAKRVVLDTIDALFAGLPDEATVRSELRRLLGWLKESGLTAVITAERGERSLTRHGVEEYVSDCVILLDHRVRDEISTRRLRVVKYRGSSHGNNEYPFLIDARGISVLPVTSLGLQHAAFDEQVSTGVAGLDRMLAGGGYFKGSSVMVSGAPGAGKTSLAAHFIDAACRRGERAIYFSFEESPRQLIRNMRSVGIDLQRWVDSGLLVCHAARPTESGLETHLAVMQRELREVAPRAVVVDPISALLTASNRGQVMLMALRLVDHLKSIGATSLLLNLQPDPLHAEVDIMSLMDTWITLQPHPGTDDGRRRLQIVKSRGMAHELRPLPMDITAQGVRIGHEERPR